MGFIASQSITTAGLWLQLGATLAILALVAGVSWLTVRYFRPGVGGANATERMSVVARLPLTPRKLLVLVRIDDREIIVGVSENNMILLGEVPGNRERPDG